MVTVFGLMVAISLYQLTIQYSESKRGGVKSHFIGFRLVGYSDGVKEAHSG